MADVPTDDLGFVPVATDDLGFVPIGPAPSLIPRAPLASTNTPADKPWYQVAGESLAKAGPVPMAGGAPVESALNAQPQSLPEAYAQAQGMKQGAATGVRYGVPALAPVGGPIGAVIGGGSEALAQLMENGQISNKGRVAASALTNTFPGGSLLKAGVGGVVKQGVKYGVTNVAAANTESLINQGQFQGTAQNAASFGLGVGAAGLGKAVESGGSLIQNAVQKNVAKDAAREAATAVGYVFPPVEANPNMVNRVTGSIAGKADTTAAASLRNQVVTNKLGAAAIGVPELTPAAIAQAEGAATQAHSAFASLSPEAQEALEEVRQTRYDAANAWYKYNTSNPGESLKKNPAQQAVAEQASRAADAAEAKMMAIDPQLGQAVIAEKTQLAKIGAVKENFDPNTNELSAAGLAKMQDKGVPLTGPLKTIADTHANFSKFLKDGSSVVVPGANKLTPMVAAGAASAGYAHFGLPGAAAGLLPFSDKPMRAAILSQPVQQSFLNRPNYPSARPDVLAYISRLAMQNQPPAPNQNFLQQLAQPVQQN